MIQVIVSGIDGYESVTLQCNDCPVTTAEVIDSRDVIARIAYLDALGVDGLDEFDAAELAALRALESEASASADWQYGETLVRDDYFEDYARELASGIGAINSDNSWPNTYIDWGRAADALQMDYFSVEYDGITYWVR